MEIQKYKLRARVSAAIHLFHATMRALRGKSIAKRVRRAGEILTGGTDAEHTTAWLDGGMAGEIRRFTNPGPEFEEFDPSIAQGRNPRAKVLAYYLPQYHEIPENNEWWGKGFTEWTNVSKGTPRFVGHYQPRIPRDLGYYTLDHGVMKRQAELAVAAGIHGFCFYFYWFGGRRLLERPLEMFLRNPDIDINFCLMWASEQWTRRWDGEDDKVLMPQDYGEHADEAFVDELCRHFKDKRYIRVSGRPLFFIYWFQKIPDGSERVAKWRELFCQRHGEDPLIFMAMTRTGDDPLAYGLDGGIDFPPHTLNTDTASPIDEKYFLDRDFQNRVYSYDAAMNKFTEKSATKFPLIRTVIPSWDNDARMPGGGVLIHGSTPAKYEAWLSSAVEYARENPVFGESFVAINAWNEWAEAAYLEPDIYYGGAYLNATARAVCQNERTG